MTRFAILPVVLFLILQMLLCAILKAQDTAELDSTEQKSKVRVILKRGGNTEVVVIDEAAIENEIEEAIEDVRVLIDDERQNCKDFFIDLRVDGKSISEEIARDVRVAVTEIEDALRNLPRIRVEIENSQGRSYRVRSSGSKSKAPFEAIVVRNPLDQDQVPKSVATTPSNVEALYDIDNERGLVKVSLPIAEPSPVRLFLYNQNGIAIYEEHRESFKGNFETLLDLSEEGKGAYFFRRETDNQTLFKTIEVL
jgi:hypothetical protein